MANERPHEHGDTPDEPGKAADGQGGEPFEGLVLDEDFIRGAHQREPSARARMLEARWRREPPRDTGFREAADRASDPFDGGTGRSAGDRYARGRRARRRALRFGLVWLILLALAYVNRYAVHDLFSSSNNRGLPGDSSPMTAQPPMSGVASGVASGPTTTPFDPKRPTREHPFAGSPAVHYADGASGIVLPDVKPVPGYSPRQVTNALVVMKRLLVEGNLNPAMTTGGDPRGYLAWIDPEHDLHTKLPKALAAQGDEAHDALDWVTRFDPGEIELVGPVVKVNGVITYAVTDAGVLSVRADYSFVYGVAKTGSGPAGEVTRVVVRRALEVWFVGQGNTRYAETRDGTVWAHDARADLSNSSCERRDGFIRPEFPEDLIGASPRSGPREDPYDRSDPILTPEPSPAPGDTAECVDLSRI